MKMKLMGIVLLCVILSSCGISTLSSTSPESIFASSSSSRESSSESMYCNLEKAPIVGHKAVSNVEQYTGLDTGPGSTIGFSVDKAVFAEGRYYYRIAGYAVIDGFIRTDTPPQTDWYYVDIYTGEVFASSTLTVDEAVTSTILSYRDAEEKACEQYGDGDPRNGFVCNTLTCVDGRLKYWLQGLNDMGDHTATFGLYYVDIYTGEVTLSP